MYWDQNDELILARMANTNRSSRVAKVDPWKVAKADCRGAIIGVVRGGITGALYGTTFPGMGTVSGAAVGGMWGMAKGMVVSSGTSAIWQTVKGWFN